MKKEKCYNLIEKICKYIYDEKLNIKYKFSYSIYTSGSGSDFKVYFDFINKQQKRQDLIYNLGCIYNLEQFIQSFREEKKKNDAEMKRQEKRDLVFSYIDNFFVNNKNNISIKEFKSFLEYIKRQEKELNNKIKLFYMYDLLGCLYNFTYNNKAIYCLDSCDNLVKFNISDDFVFCKDAIEFDLI